MLKIGLTGGIGSGKTIVANILKKLEISVYNADERAKQLTNNDAKIKKTLVGKFGNSLYKKNKLDKKMLSKLIFGNSENLEFVNSIIHPIVMQDYEKWLKKKKGFKTIVKESAILYESNTSNNLDKIICIKTPNVIKIERVMKRDGRTKDEVQEIIDKQLTDEYKSSKADYTIINDDKRLVLPQVLKIYKELKMF